jgi:hypothetical protein
MARFNWELISTATPTMAMKRHRASNDNNDGKVVFPGSYAASHIAGATHRRKTDELGEPGGTRLDAGEYDERGEASHKGGVKMA